MGTIQSVSHNFYSHNHASLNPHRQSTLYQHRDYCFSKNLNSHLPTSPSTFVGCATNEKKMIVLFNVV